MLPCFKETPLGPYFLCLPQLMRKVATDARGRRAPSGFVYSRTPYRKGIVRLISDVPDRKLSSGSDY